MKASVKELKDQNKNEKYLDNEGKLCYNNRRYFLLWSLKSVQGRADKCCKSTQMVAVTKCIITKKKKTQENVDAYN